MTKAELNSVIGKFNGCSWNYTESLDAMYQVEIRLDAEQWAKYRAKLKLVACAKTDEEFERELKPNLLPHFSRKRAYSQATALQRAEALVLALDLKP